MVIYNKFFYEFWVERLEPVAIINQFADIYNVPKAGSWEPSGIINTEDYLEKEHG